MYSELYHIFYDLLSLSRLYSYGSRVRALCSVYGYVPPSNEFLNLYAKLEGLAKKIDKLSEIPPSSSIGFIEKILREFDYSVILFDNLGMPEIMEIASRFEVLVAFFVINPHGDTAAFKTYFLVRYMRNLAEKYAMDFLNFPDKIIHKLSDHVDKCPDFSLNELIEYLYNNLTLRIIRIISKVEDDKILLMADHGYDIIKRGDNFSVCHGYECLSAKGKLIFSKIAPIMLIRRAT
mgnify:CR=1 FL=1